MDATRQYECLFYELTQEVKRKKKKKQNQKVLSVTKQNLKEQN